MRPASTDQATLDAYEQITNPTGFIKEPTRYGLCNNCHSGESYSDPQDLHEEHAEAEHGGMTTPVPIVILSKLLETVLTKDETAPHLTVRGCFY